MCPCSKQVPLLPPSSKTEIKISERAAFKNSTTTFQPRKLTDLGHIFILYFNS